MKTISAFISAILLAVCLPLSAKADNNKHLSLRASFDMTTSSTHNKLCSFGPGASVGVVYHFPFSGNFFFEAGPYFMFNTFGFDSYNNRGTVLKKYDGHINDIGIKIPIDFGYNVLRTKIIDLGVYTGPVAYVNFHTRGHFITEYNDKTENFKLPNGGMDLGWNLGVSAEIATRWHVAVEGFYGLSNMCRIDYNLTAKGNEPPAFRRAGVSIVLGYNF
ncbi:MAG: PorT family protein [Muribaculaceae bacterium]|nr:PorT family protein [Muribaculaceae bacterium]